MKFTIMVVRNAEIIDYSPDSSGEYLGNESEGLEIVADAMKELDNCNC